MANTNTVIQILRSYSNTAPSFLHDGEMAYSFVSNTMYIGDQNNDVIVIGGQYYSNTIDSATANDTPNTIVLRDENGVTNVIIALIDGGGF